MGSFNGNIGTPSGGFNLLVEYTISQNIEGNYSDVTATGYVKRNNSTYVPFNDVSLSNLIINGTGKSYTGSYDLRSDGYKSILSNTVRVPHNNDGTKSIEIAFSFDGKLSNWYPYGMISQSITLPQIPRASDIACGSPYIGDTAIISIDKKASSFTNTLTYKIGTLTGIIATNTSATTVQFQTSAIADQIYSLIPNGKEIQGTIYCVTYNGSTQIGDTQSTNFNLYAKETVCKPDVTATVVDTNTSVTSITGSNTKFVKHISKPKVTVNATAKKSSSIKNYLINLNDGQTSSTKENTFSTIASNKVTVFVVDSRNYSNSKDISLDMVNYIKLHLDTISINRPEGTSSEAILNCSGAYYNGSFSDTISNTLSGSFKYRKSGVTSWTDGGSISPVISGNTFSISDLALGTLFDYEEEYQIEVTFEDKFVIEKETISLEKGQEVVAIGDDKVWVNGDLFIKDKKIWELIYPIGSIYMSWNSTNPKNLFGGTWVQLKGGYLYGARTGSEVNDKGTNAVIGGHALTVAEMPKHRHKFVSQQWFGSQEVYDASTGAIFSWKSGEGTGGSTSKAYSNETIENGSGNAHTHDLSYIAIFVWRRTG